MRWMLNRLRVIVSFHRRQDPSSTTIQRGVITSWCGRRPSIGWQPRVPTHVTFICVSLCSSVEEPTASTSWLEPTVTQRLTLISSFIMVHHYQRHVRVERLTTTQ